jgi:quinol monooxygenase YgiN
MKSSAPRTAEMVQALRLISRAARAEKGLLDCRILLDADDANTVDYEERWKTREDFDDQVRSPRYTQLLALMESASEQPSLEFHFFADTRGLEYVAELRGEPSTP